MGNSEMLFLIYIITKICSLLPCVLPCINMSLATFTGTYTDFIQCTMMLDGDKWSFINRPYIFPIINNKFKRMLLMTARQVEKSTTFSGIQLSKACTRPNKSLLYVAPTFKQTGVYSRKKIDEVFETSPLLRKNFYPGVRGFRVEEKRLKNLTTLYFRSAYHDADSIRGLTSDDTSFDEVQDMLKEVFAIIEACSLRKLDAQFRYAGTPKTMDNNIQTMWDITSACEWHCKCLHCGYWNKLGIEVVLLDKPGIWCRKCRLELEVNKGCWVQARESDDFAGFRMPYVILHKSYVDWKDLFFKIRNYDTGALMNEVFGESYDNGSKPLTREQLIRACSSTRHMWAEVPLDLAGSEYYAGIDWGGGNTGFTVLTIGYYCASTGKFKIVFAKRYIGKEAEPENVTVSIAQSLIHFKVSIVGADQGFGFGLNDKMRKLLPSHFTYVTFRHSIIKKAIAYDEHGNTYVTNRTEVMTDLFNAIKSEKVEPYMWSEFEDIGKDYNNINAEYSDRLRQMKYIHTQPDDAFHSALYCRLPWMIKTKQMISTRLEPGDSEPDVIIDERD